MTVTRYYVSWTVIDEEKVEVTHNEAHDSLDAARAALAAAVAEGAVPVDLTTEKGEACAVLRRVTTTTDTGYGP